MESGLKGSRKLGNPRRFYLAVRIRTMPNHQQSTSQDHMALIHFDDDDEDDVMPSTWQTFSQKFKEQPLVPLGAGATTIALVGAARAIQRGESSKFNLWCRYRILFQGLTLVAALGGSMIYSHNNKQDIQDQKARVEAQELERIRQRDLRIQAQELNLDPKPAPLPLPPSSLDSSNPLFQNQNLNIRKTLQDRKRADLQNKSALSNSLPKSDTQK